MFESSATLSGDLLSERYKNERLFCACAFINPEGALEKCAWLEPSDFIKQDYGSFWKGLKDHGDSMRAASEAHILMEITEASTEIATSMFPENYANEIKRYDYLSSVSSGIASIALAISEHDESAVRENVAKLHTLGPGPVINTNYSLPVDISNEFIQRINTQTPSLLTGINDLDGLLGGLFVGELTIMAGRPGIGKTSVATAIAQNIATANKDAKILFFSLEMDKIQLWARMACAKTMHSWKEVRSGRADKYALEAVEKASQQLEQELGERLIIVDNVWDVPSIVAIAHDIKPALAIIDHLSEIRWKDDNADEVKWFGRATKIIRTEIARRMHIPVILIHQLSRGVEGRDDKRPILKDLKWSGDLEAIADTVIMLYREDYYDDENPQKPVVVPMEMWIRKNRQGVMNSCAIVDFDTRTQRFSVARAPTGNVKVGATRLPPIDYTEH